MRLCGIYIGSRDWDQERRDRLFARIDEWGLHGCRTRSNILRLDAKLACSFSDRDMRAAERPAAAQRHIDTEPQAPRLLHRKMQRIQMFRRKEWGVLKPGGGIIERKRIKVGNLHSADSDRFHLFQFAS